jgi:hypothetical protein
MSKDEAVRQFSGAVFKLKEGEGFAFAASPFARHSASGTVLVLSGERISSSRKYRKSDWMDRHVSHVATAA